MVEKRGKGRQPGAIITEAHRVKIANSQVLSRLIKHFEGSLDLSQTQVTVGLALLKKILPDLQSISAELTGKDGGPIETKDVSDLEIARRVAFLLAKAGKIKD